MGRQGSYRVVRERPDFFGNGSILTNPLLASSCIESTDGGRCWLCHKLTHDIRFPGDERLPAVAVAHLVAAGHLESRSGLANP